MLHPPLSLIEIANFSISQIESLFLSAIEISKHPRSQTFAAKTAALLFFEPSTRTRFSFEVAAARLGMSSLLLSGERGTSLEKGESIDDTILNIAAMEPSVMVIRCGDDLDLYRLQSRISTPILNAGWGKRAHPTQALLDVLTLKAEGRDLKSEKILVVGDIKHSRVIRSHFELAKILGYEIALCGPDEFMPESFLGPCFDDLEQGLKWATSVMALRVQHERHEGKFSNAEYHKHFGINAQKLSSWRSDGCILHPGPVNYGVELSEEIQYDPRCRIFHQVRWGTYLRQALLVDVLKRKAEL